MDKVHAKRLLKLADRMEKVPRKNFDMGNWYWETPCGTTCCILGHAACMPEFKKLGLKIEKVQVPEEERTEGGVVFEGLENRSAGEKFFGLTQDESVSLFLSDTIDTPHEAAEAIRKLVHKYHPE